ncbi:pentapeptide repeat-containing protein [Fischerella sp. PCC 9605]|uniref:pentapeptide repeat-containing protein n=1 Tax=Fischerella sp. PCC 9605 TaxID=1173024 RepID=UPI00047B5BA3|nr:pentapeptide repeat-containing protein [Fischerella sp. PCC 9605]
MTKNFAGKVIKGYSFRNEDLKNADFGNCRIESVDFTHANLSGANFSGAKIGVNFRWLIFITGLLFFLSILTGISLTSAMAPTLKSINGSFISTFIVFFMAGVFLFFTARRGLTGALLSGGICFVLALIGSAPLMIIRVKNEVVPGALNGVYILAVTAIGIIIFAFAVAGVTVLIEWWAGVIAAIITIKASVATAFLVSSNGFVQLKVTVLVGFIVALGFYIARNSLLGDKKFSLIRSAAILYATWRGTSFREANLTDASFAKATLKSTNFQNANLTRTQWYQTQNLDRVYVRNSYLQYPEVRQLVTTLEAQELNFDLLNLSGVNLKGANLQDASFIGTALNHANLQDVNLSRAVLKQTQLDGADLTGACLTGAYIEDWGITGETQLNGVCCEYVYMHVPTKEDPDPLRKPDNRQEIFEDGDFADFIKPIVDTIDLYHNQGVDPRAIAISFKQLAENHPDAELEIVAMEKRGQDKFLLRAKTNPNADRSELSAEYFSTYNYIKTLSTREIKLLFAEKDSQISRFENMVITALERPSFFAGTYYNQGDTMFSKEESSNYDLRGSKFGGGFAGTKGTQTGGAFYDYSTNSTLTQTAAEIQQLLKEAEANTPTTTNAQKMAVVANVVDRIEQNTDLKARVVATLETGSIETLKQAINHPLAKNLMPFIEDWMSVV